MLVILDEDDMLSEESSLVSESHSSILGLVDYNKSRANNVECV
jgi:hypothetical protein